MYCKHCGTPLNDDAEFCIQCGTKVEKEIPVSPVTEEAPVETAQAGTTQDEKAQVEPLFIQPAKPQKTKKKKGVAIVISLILVALVAVGAVLTVNGYLPNLIAKLTKTDAEYLQWVLKSSKDDLLAGMKNTGKKEDVQVKDNFGFTLTDDGKTFLEDLGIQANIDWLDSAGAEFTVDNDKKGEKSKISATILVNDKSLGSCSAIFDNRNASTYVSVPNYFDTPVYLEDGVAVGYPTGVFSALANGISFAENSWKDSSISTFISAYSELETLAEYRNELLSEYLDIVIEHLNDVQTKETEVIAGGISQKCTKYIVSLDYRTLIDCAEDILKKAKDDKKLKELLREVFESIKSDDTVYDVDETLDQIYAMMDELLEETDPDDEEKLDIVFNVYITSSSDIIGAEVLFADVIDGKDYDGFVISLYLPTDGTDLGFLLEVEQYDRGEKTTLGSLKGSGKLTGAVLCGDFTLTVMEEKLVTITIESFDFSEYAKGNLNGTIIATPMNYLTQYLDVVKGMSIEIDMDGNSDDIKLQFSLVKATRKLATVDFEYTYGVPDMINAPVNYTSDDKFDVDNVDMDKLNAKMKEAGIPEELLDTIFAE